MKTESLNVHDHHLGKFETYTRRLVDIHHVTPEMIHTDDIAHALSNICRFGGHTSVNYSVAEHSILVAALAPKELKLEALLHDAAEAYVGDVIKPLKLVLGKTYTDIEDRFMRAIILKYKLDLTKLTAVKEYDKKALELEHDCYKLNNKEAEDKIRSTIFRGCTPFYNSLDRKYCFIGLLEKYLSDRYINNAEEAFNPNF